jgi:glycosyltransferase involved in cell wall biosynthesis
MTARAALITPFGAPSVRGNAITVDRIARGLGERGMEVRVWDCSVTPEVTVESEVAAFRHALVHAFHAYRVGPLALRIARRAEIPLLVTITGTDANHDLFDPERAAVVRRVLEGAAAVTVFHESIRDWIAGAMPDLAARIVVVPQSVRLPDGEPFDLAARWPLPPDRVLFVFPAGIRMVKQPRFPLRPFDRLVARRPQVRLLYAGPILAPEEGEALLREIAGRPWARHVGTVPHARMRSLLEAADVVINASISEGGMANSVLEAMAVARPVLASDIPGNRSVVEDGVTGFLFRVEDDFERAAERLTDDPSLRRALGEAGRAKLERLYPPSREIDGYDSVYRRLVPVEGRAIH